MLNLILIDDTTCKDDLDSFVAKHKKSCKLVLNSNSPFSPELWPLHSFPDLSGGSRKLAVNTTESLTVLGIDDIVRCESNRNYTMVYLNVKKKIIVSKTLMELETLLVKFNFFRIHKSHLINLNFLDKYVKSEGGYVVLHDGTKLPVAIRKKEALFANLKNLNALI
jgi:two-component system, LytTR family, response regulator